MEPRSNPRGGRLRTACDLCRHKKISCDGEKPACETCRLAGVPCNITPQGPSEKKSMREQLAEARARIQEMEERTATPQPNIGVHIRDPANFDEAMDIFMWHLACAGPLSPSSSRREAFLSAVYSRTGHAFDLDVFATRTREAYKAKHPNRASRTLIQKWPAIDLTKKCIEHYTSQRLYAVFPIAKPSRLQALLDEYSSQPLGKREHTVVKAFLVAFTAFMTQIHRHLPAFADAEPDCYVLAVLSLLPQLILEPRNVEALQAVMVMAQYITPTGQTEAGQLLLGVAVRMLYNLGAHRVRPTTASTEEHSHLRALFWACYGMDKEMSIRSVQPPLINDAECDLDLPPNYIQSASVHQFVDQALPDHILLYPSDLRFALLKSRLYTHLLSPTARALPEPRRLEVIRQLDHELAELKASFPAHFQPDPTAYLNPNYKVHDISLRGMNIHLEYYYCLRTIHEASIVSSMAYPGTDNAQSLPLASSVELYYHAVRSTLLYFIRVEGLVQAPTVWIHAQFILSSVIALFWNMLHDPIAATFHSDLRLLDDMKALFTRLCENCWEAAPLPPLFILEGFLEMLCDLARRAQRPPAQ
ncbi:hypothetical protein BJX68DRAFT_275474 [Aspergillus pseudodeflectus]|uniref:Zn(2)-C6 fungal-type domain-containing protein n=1 Tax=Aspergillus pseudodeflectus TaxID=176178 RepID=A0ABR4L641_9EURO